jgi:nitrite reductase/ring-hydroxylating ferredoxin subunit
MYKHGWFQVAFERDVVDELTAVAIGSTRLVLVKTEEGVNAYSADCPHRGAHLAYGGKLQGDCIICPFHGYHVGLGKVSRQNFRTPVFETLTVGGLVFVRLSDQFDNGFTPFVTHLAQDHVFVPGFTMMVKAPAALVTENGFDSSHFPAVHGIVNHPKFTVQYGEDGQLVVTSLFKVPSPDPRQPEPRSVPYKASTFSPGLIVVQLTGDAPYTVITATTPISTNEARIHLSLALPIAAYGPKPPPQMTQAILTYSRGGLEDDQVMWENMSLAQPPKYVAQDAAILQFHEFCERFAENEVEIVHTNGVHHYEAT